MAVSSIARMRAGRVFVVLLAASALALLPMAGCPGSSPPPPATGETRVLVGQVEGTGARVGLVTDGMEIVAYVCDGIEGENSLSGWYEGVIQDGAFSLGLVSGTGYEGTGADRRLTGTILGETVSGQYEVGGGVAHAWQAAPAAEDASGSLYVGSSEDLLAGVVVTNDGAGVGLARSQVTGWTTRVILPAVLPKDGTLEVVAGLRPIPVSIIRDLLDLRGRIRPPADPLPTQGNGTLMVMAVVQNDQVVGYRYVQNRADRIGVPTIRRTELLRSNPPPRVLHTTMRVRVLDQNGGVLAGQFIPDPLARRYEVPADRKGLSPFWVDVDRDVPSFLVAVPNIKGAQRLVFTRFDETDREVPSGELDLSAKPVARDKDIRRQQVATAYDPADAEHATVAYNGPPEERFDLLILAEGFRDTNEDRLAFEQGVQDVLSYIWSIPNYAEYQYAINVHTAYLPSVESGANHPERDPPVAVDTPFGAFYNCNNILRLLCLTPEGHGLAYEVAQGSPGNYGAGSVDAIMVLVNDPVYGGAGGAIPTASLDVASPEIAAHELGHTVFDLADEYEIEYPALVESSRTKVNVSGPIESREELKWIDMVHPSTAIPTEVDPGTCTHDLDCPPAPSILPTGTVGMYEGAGYVGCGSYRPTTYCHMRCYVHLFCPVCAGAFHATLGPFQPPTVDLYMRDNRLDTGALPSPSNVEDPPGSGERVKPWQSVDIRVDAPPFDGVAGVDLPHENPVAGVLNRVWMVVRNRGSLPAGEFANVNLFVASATGGAPPFPGTNWTLIGSVGATVPGNGSAPFLVNWNVPADAARHTCFIATVASPSDPLPPLTGPLSSLVRNSNNITWKNLHIVQVPEIAGEISNFLREVQPVVFRISAPGVPLGTSFTLTHEDILAMSEFQPNDLRQMDLVQNVGTLWTFERADALQEWFSLRVDLPPGDANSGFRSDFLLKVQLPGGTPAGTTFNVGIEQIAVDPDSGILGEVIGGNTYAVSF